LPKPAREYVKRLESLLAVKMSIVSVGAGRDLTILRQPTFF
jgi:adenylosuccinate synthase